MKPGGKWVPTLWVGHIEEKETTKKEIDPLACKFGHALFSQQKWADEEGVTIGLCLSIDPLACEFGHAAFMEKEWKEWADKQAEIMAASVS